MSLNTKSIFQVKRPVLYFFERFGLLPVVIVFCPNKDTNNNSECE